MQIKLFRIYIVKYFFSIVGQRKKFPMERQRVVLMYIVVLIVEYIIQNY